MSAFAEQLPQDAATPPPQPGEARLLRPDIHLNVDFTPEFAQLEWYQQISALRAQHSLNSMSLRGHLDLGAARRMLDFGAGYGGGTFVLSHLARLNGGEVDAVERDHERAEVIVADGILPPGQVHVSDGPFFLKRAAARGQRYDLITAFMMGPDYDGILTQRLLIGAAAALDTDGRLVVASDPRTMKVATNVCQQGGVAFNYHSPPPRESYGIGYPSETQTMVIGRSSLEGSSYL